MVFLGILALIFGGFIVLFNWFAPLLSKHYNRHVSIIPIFGAALLGIGIFFTTGSWAWSFIAIPVDLATVEFILGFPLIIREFFLTANSRVLLRHTSSDGCLQLVVEDVGENDIAIGFEGTPWHTHAEILATKRQCSESAAIQGFVGDLFANNLIVVISHVDDVVEDIWITDAPIQDIRKHPNRKLEFRFWDGSKPHIAT